MARKKKGEVSFGDMVDALGGGPFVEVNEYVSTGILAYDSIITGRGLPLGCMLEVFGRWETGKTLLAIYLLAHVQRKGFLPVFFDTERAFKASMARGAGLDMSDMLYFPKKGGPQVTTESLFDSIKELLSIESERRMIIIVDSLAALKSKDSLEDTFHGRAGQRNAALVTEGVAAIRGPVEHCQAVVIFNNQARAADFGDRSPGAFAIDHYIDYKFQLTSAKMKPVQSKNVKRVPGRVCKIRALKNRSIIPQSCSLNIWYKGAIHSRFEGYEQMLVEKKLINPKDIGFNDFEAYYKKHRKRILKSWMEEVSYTATVL